MGAEGIKIFPHLSASNITGFFNYHEQWLNQRIFGKPFEPSAAMMRGTAIETGVRFALLYGDIGAAIARALEDFDHDIAKAGIMDIDGSVIKQRDMIAPSVDIAAGALAQYGKPSYDDNGKQHKVSIKCRYGEGPDDVIPIIGYLDFVFEDVVIDLKSTSRIPSVMGEAHQIQRAIYARATGKPVKFCYVSPKKWEMKEDGNVDEVLDRIKDDIRFIDRFLLTHSEEQLSLIAEKETRSRRYSKFGW